MTKSRLGALQVALAAISWSFAGVFSKSLPWNALTSNGVRSLIAAALLMLFAFWTCVPLLVIGLFAGFRYAFNGAELGRESINKAMDKAAEAAGRVVDEIKHEE